MTSSRSRSRIWLLLMLSTGFCSMIYELALAQLLTGLLGNALARFATTLGVYVVGMGVGSICFTGKDDTRDGMLFFKAEVALFLIGLLAPLIFVGSYRLSMNVTADQNLQTWIVLTATHLVIFATGFFSGLELPILSAIAGRQKGARSGDSNVLAADYVGMFLASLAFPFILYPILGLIPAFALATGLNLVAAAVTYSLIGGRSVALKTVMAAFASINVLALIFASNIQNWLSAVYASSL